ncbi:hypothetical protein [Xenorhabdus lircayensis]|nr:hypothetical protein [Xenorhabdus lircayensis]
MKSPLNALITALNQGNVKIIDLTQTLAPDFPALQLPEQFGLV